MKTCIRLILSTLLLGTLVQAQMPATVPAPLSAPSCWDTSSAHFKDGQFLVSVDTSKAGSSGLISILSMIDRNLQMVDTIPFSVSNDNQIILVLAAPVTSRTTQEQRDAMISDANTHLDVIAGTPGVRVQCNFIYKMSL